MAGDLLSAARTTLDLRQCIPDFQSAVLGGVTLRLRTIALAPAADGAHVSRHQHPIAYDAHAERASYLPRGGDY